MPIFLRPQCLHCDDCQFPENPGIPDRPRPGGHGQPNETSQPEPAIRDLPTSEGFEAKGSAFRRDEEEDRPRHGAISAPVRFFLAGAAVAGIMVIRMTIQDPDPGPMVMFGESFLEEMLGSRVRPTLETSATSALESPAALILATATTAMALTTYHYLQRDRIHQDACIAGAVAVGVAGGWLFDLGGTSILLRVAPWCALLGMLMGGCSPTRERQDWGPDEIPVISAISKRAVSLA